MAIFDFGKKQRLHTQLYGNTTGSEMFKVDEYNNRKKVMGILSFIEITLFTIFFFEIQYIPSKVLVFLTLIFVGCGIYGYYTIKELKGLRKRLY